MTIRRLSRPTFPLRSTMNIAWEQVDFAIEAGTGQGRVIGIVPDQLVTEHLVEKIPTQDGRAIAAPHEGLLKMAVIERHRRSGAMGKGFVRGIGLQEGALASSVAHDHHNLVVVGADDRSMATAARRTAELGGGMVVAKGDTVLAELPLPIGGLMIDEPIKTVRLRLDEVLAAARQLGAELHDPFMALSFLALEVIPSLKLTDQGLIDVERFERVPLWVS